MWLGHVYCVACNDDMNDGSVELHVRRRTVKGNRADLCAIFDFPIAWNEPWVSVANVEAKIHADISSDDGMKYKREQLVFVPIGEPSTDNPQLSHRGSSQNSEANAVSQRLPSPASGASYRLCIRHLDVTGCAHHLRRSGSAQVSAETRCQVFATSGDVKQIAG
jgi:hypothetical protein